MSLRSWVELVTTIIMRDQNVSAETKEKLGGVTHELLEEIESGLTSRALDGVPPREVGDLTPDDVREKMARLAKPRRQ